MNYPHRRYNPLTDEWVLVSPQRTRRPWQGQVEESPAISRPGYDPHCYLCPGNVRANGLHNPIYTTPYVFENDFPALLSDTPTITWSHTSLLQARSERGICRVVCFSPRHDLSLADLSLEDLGLVVDTWIAQMVDLAAQPNIGYVQIFENRGAMMGASNPHPHGQIWATESLPQVIQREQTTQAAYFSQHARTLLADYLAVELLEETRLVYASRHFVALVPFWAVWPFETLVISRTPHPSLTLLAPDERVDLADLLKHLVNGYNQLFQTEFPYSMGFHQQPCDGLLHPEWHVHAHFYPPLLRSATVRKFMVGYELLGEPQRDITAEYAAECLRQLM